MPSANTGTPITGTDSAWEEDMDSHVAILVYVISKDRRKLEQQHVVILVTWYYVVMLRWMPFMPTSRMDNWIIVSMTAKAIKMAQDNHGIYDASGCDTGHEDINSFPRHSEPHRPGLGSGEWRPRERGAQCQYCFSASHMSLNIELIFSCSILGYIRCSHIEKE